MNRSNPEQSTTATPPDRNFINGLRGNAAILASTVTFPTAALLLRHVSLAATLVLGLVPLLPFLLVSLVFVVGYAAVSVLAVITTVIPRMRRDEYLAERIICLMDMITNASIAFTRATPLELTRPLTKTGVQAQMSAQTATLPAATSSPPKDAEPFYWKLFQEMMASAKDGATQIRTPDEIFAGMIRGRHAKPEARQEATAEVFAPAVEPAVVKVAA